uniref:Uncharacterized protein n=1 Tax=Arion vulgaris TaxID=1028688 RepID=A0A0B6Z5A3_9EUPU
MNLSRKNQSSTITKIHITLNETKNQSLIHKKKTPCNQTTISILHCTKYITKHGENEQIISVSDLTA